MLRIIYLNGDKVCNQTIPVLARRVLIPHSDKCPDFKDKCYYQGAILTIRRKKK